MDPEISRPTAAENETPPRANAADRALGKKKKIVIVEASGAIEERARDVAESRLTESKESQKGVRGFARRIWKHNLFHEYYRQKEIHNIREEIKASGNIYAGEETGGDHAATMGTLVEQFSSEYDEAIHTEAGEKREMLGEAADQQQREKEVAVKSEIKKLIQDFSSQDLNDERVRGSFLEEKNRVLSSLKGVKRDIIDKGDLYADNLLEVVREVQRNIEHSQKMEELDLDFDVVVGKAKSGVRTEAQFNAVDKVIEKIQNTKVGKFANEATITSAVSIAYSLATGVSKRLANSRLFAWGSFGATAALGAGIAGLREKKRTEEERRKIARDIAMGKTFSPEKSPRRKEMEEFRYETKEANALADALEQSIYRISEDGTREIRDLSQEELQTALANLTEVESRIKISNREKVDLISYSDPAKVSQERLRLDIIRGRAMVDLRKLTSGEIKHPSNKGKFDYKVEGLATADQIESYRKTPEYQNETDELKRKNLLAFWLHEKRLHEGFRVEDIENVQGKFNPDAATAYARWDWYRAEEILAAEKAARQTEDVVLGKNLKIPDGKSLDEFVSSLTGGRMESIVKGDEGMEKRDALFRVMRNKRVAHAVVKGLVTGIVIGGAAQEIGAFFKEGQEGLIKGLVEGHKAVAQGPMHMTSLEYLRRYFTGDLPRAGNGIVHEVVIGNAHMKLPEGVDLLSNPDGSFNLVRAGHVISEHVSLDASGHLTAASNHMLAEQGITTTSSTELVQGTPRVVDVAPDEYVRANGHDFTKVHRELWYGNDTPAPVFDKNELRADLLVDHHNGEYQFSMARMTPEGSYQAANGVTLSADAHALAAAGKLKMIFSLSRDTQNQVVEVPIGSDFKAHIDPNSDIGKMFFQTVDGKPTFIGKFAEVAQVTGNKDGVEQVRLLATAVGKGITAVTDPIPTTDHIPMNIFDMPADYRVDPPPFIPIFGRRPLEPAELKGVTGITQEYYYSGGKEDYGLLDRKKYRERMSPEILKNKELDLSGKDLTIVREYLDKQDETYLAELKNLISGEKPMGRNIETVITVPAYQEGKNLEKTLRRYAKMNDKDRFELVILENHPEGVSRDDSADVIKKMKAEFPDLNIVHLYKTFKEKPPIGQVRKYLVDSVLLRKSENNIEKSVAIASNDADLEDISVDYANHLAVAFQNNKKLDAIAGKWDFPEESFRQFPLFHASQRLWHYLDIAFRNYYLKAPELIGRNSAFRSGSYAAVGGYNEKAQLAEDLEIGWLMKDARGYDAKRIGYLNPAWLVSNPRRAVTKMVSGGRLIEQYGDFHVNEEVRKASLETLLKEKRDFDEGGFGTEAQSIYDHYARMKKSNGGWVDDKYVDRSFNRAMRFLGVNYEMDEGKVKITDMTRLRAGLKEYEEKAA
jgi:hypothetical protein